jgi:hypothetical protein
MNMGIIDQAAQIIENYSHPFYKLPEANAKIWRYIDLPKFISMIQRASIYLNRADLLDDNYEGAINKLTVDRRTRWTQKVVEDLSSKVFGRSPNTKKPMSKQEFESIWLHGFNIDYDLDAKARTKTFLNCWHVNEHESVAMWKLYAETNGSIALQSTTARLFASLIEYNQKVYQQFRLGLVNYIDFENDTINTGYALSRFFFKRKSFQHESELRIVSQLSDQFKLQFEEHTNLVKADSNDIIGIELKMDLTSLIESIYVSPLAPRWFVDVVENLISTYGYSFRTNHSKIGVSPIY